MGKASCKRQWPLTANITHPPTTGKNGRGRCNNKSKRNDGGKDNGEERIDWQFHKEKDGPHTGWLLHMTQPLAM